MNDKSYLLHLIILSIFLSCCVTVTAIAIDTAGTGPELNKLTNYPRIEHFDQGTVQVDFPSLESWPDFRFLRAWLPVEVSLNGDTQPQVGSVYVQALTDINFENRTVGISDLKVLKTEFSDGHDPDSVTELVSRAFEGRESIVPLDILLRLLPENFEIPDHGAGISLLNFDPPVILVSETPLKLLSIDKEPVKVLIKDTELDYVVNTNWNVFYYRPDEQWYVLNDNAWQQNNYLADGGWTTTDKLPSDHEKGHVLFSVPGTRQARLSLIEVALPHRVLVAKDAAEKLEVKWAGEPRFGVIDTTKLHPLGGTGR